MPQTTPQMKTTTEEPKLFLAIELSEKSWKLLFSDGKYQRCATVGVGDVAGVMREAAKSREKLKLPEKCPLFSLYEAGRDGFWIHRALEKQKVSNVVADPASIEVDQRARRVKTDAVDLQKLLRHLIRYVKGEREAVRPVVVPTPAEEDARRRGRELNRLKQERTGHLCRIKSLLAVVGVRNVKLAKLTEIKTWEGKALPPILLGELQREYERLEVTNEHIQAVLMDREQLLEKAAAGQKVPRLVQKVLMLMRLKGIGQLSSWCFVEEFFGWRKFKNRRQVGGAAGMGPAPFSSGNEERDQGITKAGNKRVRTMAVQIAWVWLRFQPDSALSKWFVGRFSETPRARRVGIVALGRRLLVALWRYLEHGVVPEGAIVAVD